MSSAQREVVWRAVGGDGVQLDVTEAGDELSNLCGFAEVLLELEVDAGHLRPGGVGAEQVLLVLLKRAEAAVNAPAIFRLD